MIAQSLRVYQVETIGLSDSPGATTDSVGLADPYTVALVLIHQKELSEDQVEWDHNYPNLGSTWKSLP